MKKLYLTTSGTEMIIRLKALAREVEGRLLHGINAAEVNTFMDVLGKIHTNGGLEDEFCCLQENNQNDNIQNENN